MTTTETEKQELKREHEQQEAEAEIAALEREHGRLEDHEIAEVLCDSVDRGTGSNGRGVSIMAGFARRLKEQRERGEQTNHSDFVARDGRTARVILGRPDGGMVAMEHGSAGYRRGPYVFVVLPSAADGTVSLMHLPADVEPLKVVCEKSALMSSTRPADRALVDDVPDNYFPELSDADRCDLWAAVSPAVHHSINLVGMGSTVEDALERVDHSAMDRLMKERPDLAMRAGAILARRRSLGIPLGSVTRGRRR